MWQRGRHIMARRKIEDISLPLPFDAEPFLQAMAKQAQRHQATREWPVSWQLFLNAVNADETFAACEQFRQACAAADAQQSRPSILKRTGDWWRNRAESILDLQWWQFRQWLAREWQALWRRPAPLSPGEMAFQLPDGRLTNVYAQGATPLGVVIAVTPGYVQIAINGEVICGGDHRQSDGA